MIPAPAYAATPNLTTAQIWFLAFHTRRTDPPMKWSLHWRDTLLQATTAMGQSATIKVVEFEALVAARLMRHVGEFGADVTVAGRDLVQR